MLTFKEYSLSNYSLFFIIFYGGKIVLNFSIIMLIVIFFSVPGLNVKDDNLFCVYDIKAIQIESFRFT